MDHNILHAMQRDITQVDLEHYEVCIVCDRLIVDTAIKWREHYIHAPERGGCYCHSKCFRKLLHSLTEI